MSLKWSLLTLLIIILIYGFADSYLNNVTQTYSDGSIRFTYDYSDFHDCSLQSLPVKSIEDKGWLPVASFEKGSVIFITILTNEGFKDPEVAQKTSEAIIKSDKSAKILSSTKETNPFGIIIFKSVYTTKNQNSDDPNEIANCIDFYFKDNKTGTVYLISIHGDEESQNKYGNNAANTIFNSLTLN